MLKKKNIYCMYAISLLQGMVFYGPIATLYRQNAGLDIFSITLIESISLVLMIALELPWGVVADQMGYRKTMIVCSFLFFISKIVFYQATSFLGFLCERLLLSVVISGLSGVDSSLLYLSCPEEKSQQVFAIYQQLGTVGMITASMIYSAFIKDDYRFAGFLTIISYGLAALFALCIEEVHEHNKQSGVRRKKMFQAVQRLFNQKTLFLFVVGMALVNETHQTITVYLNQLQYIACGMSHQSIGFVYMVMILAGLVGFFSMQVTQKLKMEKALKCFIMVSIISCLCLSLTHQAIVSILAILLLHIAYHLLWPLQMKIQNQEVVSSQRATELSVNAIVMDAIAVLTNLIIGKIADLSLSNAFLLGAVFCTIGYLCCCCYLKMRERE